MFKHCVRMGVLAGVVLTGSMTQSQADWPQYRGPNHDGIAPEKISKPWPAGGLRPVWKVDLNNGFSSFTIAQGRAFTLVTRAVDGLDQEVCVALDAQTGQELWSAALGKAKYDGGGDSGTQNNRGGDGPRSTPTIDGDRVYTLSAYLVLNCFEAATGKSVWTKDLCQEYGGKVITWQNAASPLIEGDLIFVNGNAPGQCLLGLNKKDGSLVWKGQNDKMTHVTPLPATILGQRQIIFFAQSGLVSVKPEDGQVLWRYPYRYNVSTAASPVVVGDVVYCSAGYGVGGAAIRIQKSGEQFRVEELWKTPNKTVSHWSTPVHHEGYLYGLFGFKEYGSAPLKCVELATGKEMWSKDNFGPGGLLLVDGHLVVLNDQGELILVEATPKEYREISRFDALDGKCWNTLALTGGRIYARSTRQGVCLEAR